MILPQTAEYALRAMTYLASRPLGEAQRASDLAQSTDIPVHYLSKILRRLVAQGLLTSEKGHGGGFALALAPEHIRFLDVLLAAGFSAAPNRCAFGWGNCNPQNPCPLHPAWSKLNDSFWLWATSTTLADVRVDDAVLTGHGRRVQR